MKKLVVILITTLLCSIGLRAQQQGVIEGTVSDGETKQPLQGANVVVQGTTLGASTGADGTFRIVQVPPGKYTLAVSYVGYAVKKQSLSVKEGERVVVDLFLAPTILPGQEIVVTATRAKERETPVTFSNLNAQQIAQRYWSQDIPMLLSELPNVYAYSDNGNGIGYSYMSMRGFSQKRIGVMVNGIPLNDADSHEVYWVDLPDIAASTEDIQVQRGVGTSLYGASAFGGLVNLLTHTRVRPAGIEASIGYGSFNTKKISIAARSGLIDNTYNLNARFSRIQTDGYRQPSWSKLWSYFISVTRFDETMTTRFNLFGGPEQSYLSYRGVVRDQLDDARKRKTNPFQYPNEVDNFYQPHFQLLNEWQVSPRLTLENSFFTFLGFGHYTQFRSGRDVREYNIPRFVIRDSTLLPRGYYRNIDRDAVRDSFQVRLLDIVRRRSVDDVDYGWLPRMTWKLDRAELLLGGEYRQHRSEHWGEVIWANLLPPGITPDWRYYGYDVTKSFYALYAQVLVRPMADLTLLGNLQWSHRRIGLENEQNHNVSFTRSYTFVMPRFGVNYNLTPTLQTFFNFSVAQREPAFKDIFDPQNYWTNPINLPRNFERTADGYRYVGKELKPEKFNNLELGVSYRTETHRLNLNLFWMDFRDEIVASGQIDDNGVPISGNAERTVHQGIELSGSTRPLTWLSIEGNLALNDNRFVKHAEYVVTDWNTTPPKTERVVYDKKRIGGFPEVLSNLRITTDFDPLQFSIHLQNIGRIYLDNSERRDVSIDPVTLLNASVALKATSVFGFPPMEVRLTVNNLGDTLYAAAGYVEEGVAFYIPAAGRNLFASVKVEL
jgi:iron complex outermembrane receptor protein